MVLLLGWWGSGGFGARRPRQLPLTAPATTLPSAPDLELSLYPGHRVVGSERVRLSALWADRPVIVNFLAGLCPPCRAELPAFQRLYVSRGGGQRFHLVGVDIGPFIGLGSQEDGRALLRELGVTFPAGTVSDAQAVRRYQIVGMPTTVFIARGGGIWRRHTGLLTAGQMEELLAGLLEVSRAP
ncbi:MAG: TlpA disulfide reductase family protein [Armatimonadota bacterium]|nr:TlpA disulfide reductase family protein [Armatimonadota bacterium]MDR7458966.1 TlpA disulfide reductase family protein [Armatimonadota bacterium]MDR7574827.1 TlpA disulfide reductase family protein [Armatimonadota bacterium]